jgi:TPR repeat protein
MKKLLIVFVCILSMLSANIDEAIKVYYAKDFKKALPMFEQLKREENIESNYYLGTMYYSAYGVKQDYKKAFEYYTLASNLPNKKRLKSIFNIATMHAQGKGVIEDNQKAFKFFKILDDENIGVAQYYMGLMYTNGYGIQEDQKKAVLYYEKGCNSKKSYPKSCYYAGDHYEKGIGVEENYSIAKKYYTKACEAGIKESCEAIKNMKEPLSFYKKYYWHMLLSLILIGLLRMWYDKRK